MDCFALKFYHDKERESSTIMPELSNKRIDFPSRQNDMVVNFYCMANFISDAKKFGKAIRNAHNSTDFHIRCNKELKRDYGFFFVFFLSFFLFLSNNTTLCEC